MLHTVETLTHPERATTRITASLRSPPSHDRPQVAVPLHMATTLTYPERVTTYNMRRLRTAVLAGSGSWPGANFVEKTNGQRFTLMNDRVRPASLLVCLPGLASL